MYLYTVQTKEFQRNFEREIYTRTQKDTVIMADDFVLIDNSYKFLIKGEPYETVASVPRENVLLISKKANLVSD